LRALQTVLKHTKRKWVSWVWCVCCFVLLVCFPHQSTSWSPLSVGFLFFQHLFSLPISQLHSSPQTNTKLLKDMFSGTGTICLSHFMIVWSYTLHMILMKLIILSTYDSINGMSWVLLFGSASTYLSYLMKFESYVLDMIAMKVIILSTYDLNNGMSWVLVVWICINLFELFDEVWMMCYRHDCDEGDHIVNIWLDQWNELSSGCLDLHQPIWVIWWGLNDMF
jgi:hypothetical protein